MKSFNSLNYLYSFRPVNCHKRIDFVTSSLILNRYLIGFNRKHLQDYRIGG